MDLEVINKEYLELKERLKIVNSEINVLSEKCNELSDSKIILKGKIVEAKRNKDVIDEQIFEDASNKIDTKLKEVQIEATKKREELLNVNEKINNRIKEVKENPEMKRHLEQVISKKYERKVSKLNGELVDVSEKKESAIELKKLVELHPSLGNNLKGMLSAKKEINELENELKSIADKTGKYENSEKAKEIKDTLIPKAKEKYQKNKLTLTTYIIKNKINIKDNVIEEVVNSSFIVDQKGNIDLSTTMNKNIAVYNRQIKGHEKAIANYEIAKNNIVLNKDGNLNSASNSNKDINMNQTSGSASQLFRGTPAQNQSVQNLKWYQKVVQKVREWNEKRNQKSFPTDTEQDVNSQENKASNTKNEFLSSLKYEIVQDIAKEVQKENINRAKQERKNNQQTR